MELARQHLYFFQHTTVKTANRGQDWTEEQKRASYAWHRLACLYTLGLPLHDDCIVIKDQKRYAPRDNTSLYLTHRLIERREYNGSNYHTAS